MNSSLLTRAGAGALDGSASPAPAARRWLLLLAAWASLLLTAPPVAAQAPKSGDWHEDTTDVGFRVRVPKGWNFIPPQPDSPNLIGKYEAPNDATVQLSGSRVFTVNAFLLKFDRRPPPEGQGAGAAKEAPRRRGAKDMQAWIDGAYNGVTWRKESSKGTKVDGLEAEEITWSGKTASGNDLGLYALVYRVAPDLEVAFVGDGPGEKKWSKYESAWKQMARTFKRVPLARFELSGLGSGSLRAQKRVALQNQVASQPGWELYETPNYFVVSNSKDQGFVRELMDRLEAIRAIYEVDYPASRAEEIRLLALAEANKRRAEREAERKRREATGEDEEDDGDESEEEEDEDEPVEQRTVARSADPMERSRTSVVRVCATADQYHSYGGPPSSAGYWNPRDEELVIYDDQRGGGRRNTWATLNHEAFHQYIFYFYGNIAPHSWYNEGTGDYYGGFQLKNSRFVLTPFDWRVQTIKSVIREKQHVPLKDLVRFTQAEYYGSNKYGAGGGQNYAQGWSFIYFLRTGEKQSRRWNKRWSTILDLYLETLAASRDLEKAVEKAFEGVDFDELETAWLEYTK